MRMSKREYQLKMAEIRRENVQKQYRQSLREEKRKYDTKRIETSKLLAIYLFVLFNAVMIYAMAAMYWNYEPVTLDEILAHGRTIRPNYGERSSEYNVRYPWEKQVASKSNDITWNVFYHDCNGHKIDTFNIFEHGSFREYMRKAAKKCQTKDEFAKELRSELMYYFWSKCEWEVLISPWVSQRDNQDRKVDVCWQVMNNWDVFLDYVWSNRKKL